MTQTLLFYPYVRSGLSVGATRSSGKLHVSPRVRLVGKGDRDLADANGQPFYPGGYGPDIELLGPGDIVGIDPAVITRVEPAPGAPSFPCDRLAFVEMAEPDFLFRYSPVVPSLSPARCVPWLALLVFPKGLCSVDTVVVDRQPAVRLRVPEAGRALLPDLTRLWAWAHAQSAPPSAGGEADATSGVCRLLCPMRLAMNSSYSAFLVPAYEAGRRAGLGQQVPAGEPSVWSREGSGPLDLPVYWSWDFRAGPPDDFASLLQSVGGDPTGNVSRIGARPVDASKPGYLPWDRRGDTFSVEGALLPAGAQAPPPEPTAPEFAKVLETSLLRQLAASGKGKEPVVGIPLYGAAFAPAGAKLGGWLARLNLLRKNRVAAALGAAVVRRDQEALVAACFRQVGAVGRAREILDAAQLGAVLGGRLKAKHFVPLSPGRALAFARPFADLASRGGGTLEEALATSALAGDRLSYAARRVFSRRSGAPGPRGASFAAFVQGRLDPPAAPPKARGRAALYKSSPLRSDLVPTTRVKLDRIQDLFRPAEAIRARVRDTLKISGGAPARLSHGKAGPRVGVPLCDGLIAMGVDLLLPGISALGEDTIAVFRENRPQIAAFMVGANHEMARELLWRQYPIEPGFTVLRRFWEPLDLRKGNEDIPEISRWNDADPPPDTQPGRVVFAVRGALVRRCPDLLLRVVFTRRGGSGPPSAAEVAELTARLDAGLGEAPKFRASGGEGLLFMGFSLTEAALRAPEKRAWLVLSQPPFLPAFGAKETAEIQTGSIPPAALSWAHLRTDAAGWIDPQSLAPGVTVQGWSPDTVTSASLAKLLLRHPVQRAIAVDDLLPRVAAPRSLVEGCPDPEGRV